MKIDGVVVLYNPDEKLLDNIESYINELSTLFIVDNTPNVDNTKKFEKNKKIKYIPLKENKGIAYALNVGAKEAIKDKADYLLTMDQDSRFRKGHFEKMVKMLNKVYQHSELATFLGITPNKIGVVSPFHVTKRTEKSVDLVKGVDYPLEVMCSGNLVNLDAYKKVDGFKEWMFIDCVDFEFCFNLQIHKYDIVRFNEIKLDHELGDTKRIEMLGKTLYSDNHSPIRWYYMSRNRRYIYDMYYDLFPEYCTALRKCTKKELIKIWLFENDKIKKTKAIIKGLKDYKKGVKGPGKF